MSKVVNVSNEVKNLDMEFHYGELKMVVGEEFSVNVEGVEAEKIIIEECGDVLKIYDQRQTRRIKAKNIFFGKNTGNESDRYCFFYKRRPCQVSGIPTVPDR